MRGWTVLPARASDFSDGSRSKSTRVISREFGKQFEMLRAVKFKSCHFDSDSTMASANAEAIVIYEMVQLQSCRHMCIMPF